MKKTLLILLISLFCFQGFSQDPDPELFRTWYLYFVQITDLGYPYEVSEIDPPIHPYITISEDLSFYGEGACNTFNGVYDYLGGNTLSAISNFNQTNEDCGIQIHNSFENSYFGFMPEFWYEITQESDGLTLTTSNPLMGYAIFKEYPLSTSNNSFNNLKIYPNPVSKILFISLENTVIQKVAVYNISGQIVLKQNNIQNNSIDVSGLSRGMYFLELSSETGKTVKKFIKK